VSHDREESYEYVCDKDVKYTKGCGHHGKNKISDHKYKIVWRLHWPAWKQIFGTSIEGAGIDHHTKGGSEDTCKAVTLGLMHKEYHIPYRYGFILFQGKKYSKSKGTGMGVRQMVKLIPVEIIKYMLLRPDLEENIDIDPTSQNLLRTIDDFQEAGKLDMTKVEEMNRADRKRAIAHEMSSCGTGWRVPFLDVLLYYQIYGDWNEVGRLTDDPAGVIYLKPYVEAWIAQEFIPEEYKFKYQPMAKQPTANVTRFLAGLKTGMDALALHNAMFEFAKANSMEPKQMFAEMYDALIGKPKGPRLGKLLEALGVDRVKKDFGV
jgi:lysyl-tRNA synthetase class 1